MYYYNNCQSKNFLEKEMRQKESPKQKEALK